MPENRDSHEPESNETDAPVPNRRERRGGKAAARTQQVGKPGQGYRPSPKVNPRQYSTRRRGG